ncbi:hypothetical protein OSU_1515 [Vibrio cholerae PS15]|nr:hypothetical protein OSU_1515 [Vibrio cholerae PS15]
MRFLFDKPISPFYLKSQRYWLRSLAPITEFVDAHGDYEAILGSHQR